MTLLLKFILYFYDSYIVGNHVYLMKMKVPLRLAFYRWVWNLQVNVNRLIFHDPSSSLRRHSWPTWVTAQIMYLDSSFPARVLRWGYLSKGKASLWSTLRSQPSSSLTIKKLEKPFSCSYSPIAMATLVLHQLWRRWKKAFKISF
jgi:hypothetical protein